MHSLHMGTRNQCRHELLCVGSLLFCVPAILVVVLLTASVVPYTFQHLPLKVYIHVLWIHGYDIFSFFVKRTKLERAVRMKDEGGKSMLPTLVTVGGTYVCRRTTCKKYNDNNRVNHHKVVTSGSSSCMGLIDQFCGRASTHQFISLSLCRSHEG